MLCRADKCAQRAILGPYCHEHGCRGKRCHAPAALDGLCADHLADAFAHRLDNVTGHAFERIASPRRERRTDAAH